MRSLKLSFLAVIAASLNLAYVARVNAWASSTHENSVFQAMEAEANAQYGNSIARFVLENSADKEQALRCLLEFPNIWDINRIVIGGNGTSLFNSDILYTYVNRDRKHFLYANPLDTVSTITGDAIREDLTEKGIIPLHNPTITTSNVTDDKLNLERTMKIGISYHLGPKGENSDKAIISYYTYGPHKAGRVAMPRYLGKAEIIIPFGKEPDENLIKQEIKEVFKNTFLTCVMKRGPY